VHGVCRAAPEPVADTMFELRLQQEEEKQSARGVKASSALGNATAADAVAD